MMPTDTAVIDQPLMVIAVLVPLAATLLFAFRIFPFARADPVADRSTDRAVQPSRIRRAPSHGDRAPRALHLDVRRSGWLQEDQRHVGPSGRGWGPASGRRDPGDGRAEGRHRSADRWRR